MIRINLLPFRAARKKENVRRQISIFLLSIVMVVSALFYYNIMLAGQIKELNQKKTDLQKELRSLQRQSREATRIQGQLNVLKKKTGVIKDLSVNRDEAVTLMKTMTEVIVPHRMWLTHFQTRGGQVQLNGVAVDNKTIADFMTRLEGVERFDNVTLVSSRQQAFEGGHVLKAFSLHFNKHGLTAKNKSGKTNK